MFQFGGLCENSKKKEKKNWKKPKEEKKKRKKRIQIKKNKKEKYQKEENKKGFSSNFEKWNLRKENYFEEEELKKKKCWMEIPKRVDIPTNLENTSNYLPSPIFISFPLLLPYITS